MILSEFQIGSFFLMPFAGFQLPDGGERSSINKHYRFVI